MLLEVLSLNKEKLKISESSLGLLDLLKHKSLILGIFIFHLPLKIICHAYFYWFPILLNFMLASGPTMWKFISQFPHMTFFITAKAKC